MGQYRKKPVEVEAVLFDGTNAEEIGRFAGLKARLAGREHRLEIVTEEGVMTVSPGDWVIQGVAGEFYPCKPDIFEATYEPVVTLDRCLYDVGGRSCGRSADDPVHHGETYRDGHAFVGWKGGSQL